MKTTARRPAVEDTHGNEDSLSIDLIRRALTTRVVGFEIHLHGVVSSTNDVACALAERGGREGTVVLAEAHRAGRRRLGGPWFSPDHANLYASVIFRPPAVRGTATP